VLNFLAYAEISVGQVYNHHALEGGWSFQSRYELAWSLDSTGLWTPRVTGVQDRTVRLTRGVEEKIFPAFAKAAGEVSAV
jgi:hypothetical protein